MCSAKCAIPRFSARSYREPAASMTKHATDCAWSSGAVSTRRPLASDRRSKTGMRRWYRASAARVGEHLVSVDGDAAPRPALEQVAELLRHLLVERRLGGLRA